MALIRVACSSPTQLPQAAAAAALQEVAAASAQQPQQAPQLQQPQQLPGMPARAPPPVPQLPQLPQGQEQLAIAAAHLFLSDLQQRVLSVSRTVKQSLALCC